MEHNDTDLFVIELTMTPEGLSHYTDFGYDEAKKWLQDNWGSVTESVDMSLEATLQALTGSV
jgi:hypothetical protein